MCTSQNKSFMNALCTFKRGIENGRRYAKSDYTIQKGLKMRIQNHMSWAK